MSDFVKPEEYEEPRCLLRMDGGEEKKITRIPIRRVLEKLDEALHKKDFDAARRLLDYWEREAITGGDVGGRLSVLCEKMGLFRNQNEETKAKDAAAEGLRLVEEHHLADSVMAASVFLNAGTVMKAFGDPARAVELYDRALALYEKFLPPDDYRRAGLYNNRGLALADLGRFAEAHASYDKAMAGMRLIPHGEAEMAVTCLNRANAVEAEKGLEDGAEEIAALLDQAEALFNTPDLVWDGTCAFHAEKCAPTFDYYGYFAFARTLRRRAEEYYAGT